jgi:hypothetical protein
MEPRQLCKRWCKACDRDEKPFKMFTKKEADIINTTKCTCKSRKKGTAGQGQGPSWRVSLPTCGEPLWLSGKVVKMRK